MRTILLVACLLLATLNSLNANDEAIQSARTHVSNLLNGKIDELAKTYASEVQLMPGHEFLKPEYGLATDPGRNKAVQVDRKRLVEAMRKALEDNPRDPEKMAGLLATLNYEALKTTPGKFAADPADPAGTPDGKLHFTIKEGDVLVKVAPPDPKKDFLLFHLRKIGDAWKIVSEYLD